MGCTGGAVSDGATGSNDGVGKGAISYSVRVQETNTISNRSAVRILFCFIRDLQYRISQPTVCVIRMSLLGTWHPSILEAIRPRGRGWGVSVWVVRPPVWDSLETGGARCVIWTPAEPNLGRREPEPASVAATLTRKSTSQAGPAACRGTDARSVA